MREKTRMRTPIGEIAVNEGIISNLQLKNAEDYKKQNSLKMGQALVELGYINEDQRLHLLSKHFRLKTIDLEDFVPDQELMDDLDDVAFVQNNRFIPYANDEMEYIIIVADPLNLRLHDVLRQKYNKPVTHILTHEKKLDSWLMNNLGNYRLNEELGKLKRDDEAQIIVDLDVVTEESSAVRLKVYSIFREAITRGASDIHIMAIGEETQVRLRIDGILHEIERFSASSYDALVAVIKVMAEKDTMDRRTPQDGKITVLIDGNPIGMRVSFMPADPLEKVTIRILDTSKFELEIPNLGMLPEIEGKFRDVIENPTGIILLTGPTGSGKSTTLFTVINTIKDVTKNILTVEDPIEYRMDDISQVQINDKSEVTFNDILRSMLRQDPDVILVGEIRDTETAEIAVQAANTGHLVLSTLHTNDAASSLTRLINMGIEPYMIADSLLAVVNQRLIRSLCDCKEKYILDDDDRLGQMFKIEEGSNLELYRAVGCKKCNMTGYSGRTALHELLIINSDIRDTLTHDTTSSDLRKIARENGMLTLTEDGIEKCKLGITSLEEIRRLVNL